MRDPNAAAAVRTLLGVVRAALEASTPARLCVAAELLALPLALAPRPPRWPPLPAKNSDGDSDALLGFCPGAAWPLAQSRPKLEYDVAMANIVFWAIYEESFKTLYTLAMGNHHPSKLFFDPAFSPIAGEYKDSIAAYKLGIFLREMNFLALSAQWLKIASECGHAKAMLEYAKFLCSPGWAFYLTRQTEKTQTAKHTTQPQQQSRITPEQEALLQNAIDAPLALSLLHRSYSLEPNEDTAFYIAMIYLTAPPLASFSKTLSTFNSSYRMQPEGNQSPINWALVEPTTAHTLSVHRDVKLAATWFSRSLPNSSTDPLKTPIQISAAFNLAKLHLKQDSNESHKTAVNLLQRVVATNTQEPNHTEDMGIAAAYLLGHCLIRGVGLDANDAEDDDAKASRYEQGQAWLQICRIRTEEVGDKASKDDSINKSEAIETALSNAKCQTILTNCFRQLKILVEGVLLEGNGGEELGEGNISCSPLFMLAYGLCLRFGVGTGCQPDECKGVYWIERAKRILGFRIEPEWNILVGSGLNESKSLFMDLRSMFGGHSKKAAATVGREDDEMATGIIGLQVSPAVPNLKGSASGDFSSSFEVASLPPLPPNYTVRQKASKATVSKLSSIYPPVNQILSEKVLGENMVIVEKLVEREDFD